MTEPTPHDQARPGTTPTRKKTTMQTRTEPTPADRYAAVHGITLDVERVGYDPADDRYTTPDDDQARRWNRDARHFRCTLRRPGSCYVVSTPYAQGRAHVDPPTAGDVLEALAMDSRGCDGYTFEDWAADMDMDPDSRTAERIFERVRAVAVHLRLFLPTPLDVLLDALDGDGYPPIDQDDQA